MNGQGLLGGKELRHAHLRHAKGGDGAKSVNASF
jgi:hypothetical protein